MCTSRFEESNRVICFTPDLPASTARQKSCLPMPFGLTTPIPVITTRGSMNEIQLSWNALVTTNSRQLLTARQCIIIQMPLGLYIAVPFCRTKCTYCNFASDVFSRAVFENYTTRLCAEIRQARATAQDMSGTFEATADSVY